jgi:hypothetical protein
MAVPFVRAWYRATLFGAYAYVGRPATSVLTKAQFCDGHHNLAFSREHFAKKPPDISLAQHLSAMSSFALEKRGEVSRVRLCQEARIVEDNQG